MLEKSDDKNNKKIHGFANRVKLFIRMQLRRLPTQIPVKDTHEYNVTYTRQYPSQLKK
jgi:hypothetical protein